MPYSLPTSAKHGQGGKKTRPSPLSANNSLLHLTPVSPPIQSPRRPPRRLKSSLKRASSPPSSPKSPHSRPVFNSATSNSSSLTPKCVHFPGSKESGLENVVFFKYSARPASLCRDGTGADTETESEAFTSEAQRWWSSSIVPLRHSRPLKPLAGAVVEYELECSIPTHRDGKGNVYLEYLCLKGLNLEGTILVRNISYAKQVHARFTMDDWQTTSEVGAEYIESLSSLPPSFLDPHPGGWDRFRFAIRLDHLGANLHNRVLCLVGRFQAGGGEWWDNNLGQNYRIGFRIVKR